MKPANLKPGQSIIISQSNGVTVTAERSCKGDKVRFVRTTKKGFEVFKTVDFRCL